MEYETGSESGQAGKGKVKSFANLPNLSLLGKHCNRKREKLHINNWLKFYNTLHLSELRHYYLHPREHYDHLLLQTAHFLADRDYSDTHKQVYMYLIEFYYCAQFKYKLKHVTSNSNFKRKFGKEGKKTSSTSHASTREKQERNSVKFYIPEKETVAKKKKTKQKSLL